MEKVHINPDHYLTTSQGRVWTEARSKLAWKKAYVDLEIAVQEISSDVYIVFGVQGSGKSSWIKSQAPSVPSIYFDAALPAQSHRSKAISIAKHNAKQIIAVWIDVSLELALSRNIARNYDEIVPEESLRSVYSQIEPPTLSEGFDKIIIVSSGETSIVG
ncbi:TPA: hypothetical protein NG287_004545 [Vibrio parahaemolyticus]|nr:hypothetical protein [Vibrio parahaemolyticus]HCG7352075.1 hypothetical protein [Vibrio parahaemolyticus]